MVNDESTTKTLGAPYRRSMHPQAGGPRGSDIIPAPDMGFEKQILEGGKVVLEKNHAISMRDGIILYADVYRPASEAKSPTIVFFAPFGKHGAVPREKFPNMGVDFTKLSKYTHFELPDPIPWCGEYGYSFLIVDPRGTWWSEGSEATYFSPEEGRDGYDVVEWAAAQEWSTGKIGWGAVSYYAMSAYQTAVLRPPHLEALLLWEAMSDIYREVNTPGGIPNVAFQHMWMNMTGNGLGESEDHAVASLEHPLYDAWWQSKVVDWSQIVAPTFSVTGWSSLALHLRGTIEAWKKFSSKNKYLFIHAGREWSEYYREENMRKQRLFWNRFLKDEGNEVDNWPVVTYDIRITPENVIRHSESQFPPISTITSLSIMNSGLSPESLLSGTAEYQSYISHHSGSRLEFDYLITKTTEITGHASVKLFIQCLQYPDTDIYVALQKIGHDGKEIQFWHSSQQLEASASFGWLRASHRELDPERSLLERPYHLHRRRQWLRPADIVEVQIELWPSSTIWYTREILRLVIQGTPFTDQENITQVKGPTHGFGEVRIWYGGQFNSQLILPVVPESSRYIQST